MNAGKKKKRAIRQLKKIMREFEKKDTVIHTIEIDQEISSYPGNSGYMEHYPTGWKTLSVRYFSPDG